MEYMKIGQLSSVCSPVHTPHILYLYISCKAKRQLSNVRSKDSPSSKSNRKWRESIENNKETNSNIPTKCHATQDEEQILSFGCAGNPWSGCLTALKMYLLLRRWANAPEMCASYLGGGVSDVYKFKAFKIKQRRKEKKTTRNWGEYQEAEEEADDDDDDDDEKDKNGTRWKTNGSLSKHNKANIYFCNFIEMVEIIQSERRRRCAFPHTPTLSQSNLWKCVVVFATMPPHSNRSLRNRESMPNICSGTRAKIQEQFEMREYSRVKQKQIYFTNEQHPNFKSIGVCFGYK